MADGRIDLNTGGVINVSFGANVSDRKLLMYKSMAANHGVDGKSYNPLGNEHDMYESSSIVQFSSGVFFALSTITRLISYPVARVGLIGKGSINETVTDDVGTDTVVVSIRSGETKLNVALFELIAKTDDGYDVLDCTYCNETSTDSCLEKLFTLHVKMLVF
jgi:hypothetical protein